MEFTELAIRCTIVLCGEGRAQARKLAKRIQMAGYSAFYDEFEELWGKTFR